MKVSSMLVCVCLMALSGCGKSRSSSNQNPYDYKAVRLETTRWMFYVDTSPKAETPTVKQVTANAPAKVSWLVTPDQSYMFVNAGFLNVSRQMDEMACSDAEAALNQNGKVATLERIDDNNITRQSERFFEESPGVFRWTRLVYVKDGADCVLFRFNNSEPGAKSLNPMFITTEIALTGHAFTVSKKR